MKSGDRFGRVILVRKEGVHPTRRGTMWLCACDCGGSKIIEGRLLRSGNTRSCGCVRREVSAAKGLTHGMSHRPTYRSYMAMRQRCGNPKHPAYPRYAGRGIAVCGRWLESFGNFLADMGVRPDGTSLDRIDNDGPYSPENCRWATRVEQSRNTRTNRVIAFRGVRKTLKEWTVKQGINRVTLSRRLDAEWSIEDAILLPVERGRHYTARR